MEDNDHKWPLVQATEVKERVDVDRSGEMVTFRLWSPCPYCADGREHDGLIAFDVLDKLRAKHMAFCWHSRDHAGHPRPYWVRVSAVRFTPAEPSTALQWPLRWKDGLSESTQPKAPADAS